MKFLLPLLLLSAMPVSGAEQDETSQPVHWVQRGLTAQVGGTDASRNVQDADILVFDSFTNASSYGATGASPRTYLGMPIEFDGAGGSNPSIGKLVVYAYQGGQATQVYNRLRVRVRLWESWSGANDPVFTDAAGTVEADVAGPITLAPSTYAPITIRLDSPIPLSGLTGHGVAINFQGDTGAGLQTTDLLTTLLRYGANPIAAGRNLLQPNYGYRNVSGRTDFNFGPGDGRSVQSSTEAVAMQLYATGIALTSQRITNFAASPAHPSIGNASFTVSATGGGSGNPVVFSIDPVSAAVCAAGGTNGATITILAAGTCTVRADQAGNATYGVAPQRSDNVEISDGNVIFADGFE